MIPGTGFHFDDHNFHNKHSLKVPIVTVVKKLLSLKPPPDLTLVYNQCNNISPEKTMTLKMLLTPNTVTMTKLKL